jgi:anti-sigma factor RsiW
MSNTPENPVADTHPTLASLPVTDMMLQAYVDDHLSETQRDQVEAYLATHPEQAAKVAGCRRLNQALHAQFDPILSEEVPQRLLDLFADAEQQPAQSRSPQSVGWKTKARGFLTNIFGPGSGGGIFAPAMAFGNLRLPAQAMTLAWLALGIAVGVQVQSLDRLGGMPPMVKHAAVAYITYASEVVHPVEVNASNESHLVAWLSKRLGMNLKAAKLDELGYTLMGGRLIAGTQRPVAQFMYEDKIGRRLTLYIKTQESGHDQSTAFQFAQEGEVSAFYWIDNGTGYVLSGEVDRSMLLKVAVSVYGQLNAPQAEPQSPQPKEGEHRPAKST